jgi:uncharacterized protein DUF6636
MRRLAFAAVLALLALPAGASGSTFRQFRSPTGHIGCAFESGGGLPRQVRCEWDGSNDRAFVLRQRGRTHVIKISDTVRDPHAKVLHYGRSLRFGRIKCTSRRTGMTCRNRRGHGFTVSVQHQRRF